MMSTLSRTILSESSLMRSTFPSAYRYSMTMLFPSTYPSSCRPCRNASWRAELTEEGVVSRNPIRGTFFGCCASALAPHTVSATTIAKSPAHFRFWILRRGSGHALDFRLSEEESKNRFQKVLFMQFLQSKIENRQSKMSFYDFVCPRQYVGRNRETDLLRGFKIYDQLELGRLLHQEIGGLRTFQNFVHNTTAH